VLGKRMESAVRQMGMTLPEWLRAAAANGDLDGAVATSNGRVVRFSEEERKKRSERAKQLHAQGRLGGRQIGALGGRAVNRHRLSDAVLDFFRQPDEQQLIIDAYRRALKGKNKNLGVRAADSLVRIDKDAAERDRANRGGAADPASMTDDELLELVAQGLEAMIAGGQIPADIVLDDDAVQDAE
jgi:hypothetical protein